MAPTQNPDDYSIILVTQGLVGVVKEAYAFERFLIADGTPDQAALIIGALNAFEQRLQDIGIETAVLAEKSIRHDEEASRVRPDTGGAGGNRLNDFIGVSAPLSTVPGSVGINHIPTLDDNGVSWWWTNEEGYAGHVGRTFIGAYDGTRPDPGRFREHPLLSIGKGVKGSGKGTIRKPIPERRFVRDGAAPVTADWHKKVQAARAAFESEVRAIVRRPGRRP